MSNKKFLRARHSSLEMPDPEAVVKKKQDMLTKARNKLLSLSEALKLKDVDHHRRSTFDFFKHKEKNHVFANSNVKKPKKALLQKQNSVGAYPIRIEITPDYVEDLRPATVCVDKVGDTTAALALERPRKKLSFREPEIMGNVVNRFKKTELFNTDLKRSVSVCNGILHRAHSIEDFDLESQAMRVVRTIGQAFEVCHKLSINAPENENLDDEQDTLTQDLLSDHMSDITSDKKKDLLSEGASDKMSLPPDDVSPVEASKPHHLEILPPPPNSNPKKSPLISAETYSSPHSDNLTSGSGSFGSNSLPPPGSALSAHHELQLMREQLEQQTQQTKAALAQLQLAREQLAAEQSARLEAQARTHQLLVHNRELLDHIAALVAHLQGGEKTNQPPAHVTMPQQQHQPGSGENYDHLSESTSLDNSPVYQALGLNPQGLIENRAVTSCLPSSPLRTTFNPTGSSVFNFPYPPPVDTSFDSQLLQRLQNLSGYPPPTPFHYNYPYFSGMYPQPFLNNNYTLQPPPQKKLSPSPVTSRHSYGGSPETRASPGQTPHQSQQNLSQYSSSTHLQVQQPQQQQSQRLQGSPQQERKEAQFIKPLSQIGTLTTTDSEGRVRVIVPVPSNSEDATGNLLANLRLNDELRTLNGPPITRSTSEKVPNRSELMSQVQRTMWARHTTK